jgi:hypothetical protein
VRFFVGFAPITVLNVIVELSAIADDLPTPLIECCSHEGSLHRVDVAPKCPLNLFAFLILLGGSYGVKSPNRLALARKVILAHRVTQIAGALSPHPSPDVV